MTADSTPAQSYPTFWDMIPVETAAPAPCPAAGDAYATFHDAAESGPVSLSVDRIDVG